VLGCGLDTVYPYRNRDLAKEIVNAGAIISEFPIGTLPAPQLFPVRNRIISGLSRGVLVVEAGEKSGALITVEFALEQGRDVFAVPGSILNTTSAGTNRLIRDGAELVRGADDILAALAISPREAQREARNELPSDPVEAAVLAVLSAEPCHIDAVCRASNLPLPTVSAALTMLELKGLARQPAPLQFVLR
jgi:DNA processing protein